MARMREGDSSGPFYMDRHVVRETHLSIPLEHLAAKEDFDEVDVIVVTFQYVRNDRPARKTVRFYTSELRNSL